MTFNKLIFKSIRMSQGGVWPSQDWLCTRQLSKIPANYKNTCIFPILLLQVRDTSQSILKCQFIRIQLIQNAPAFSTLKQWMIADFKDMSQKITLETINQLFNPLYTGVLFHCYMLDKYICHFKVVRSSLVLLFYFWWKILLANNVGPHQMSHYVMPHKVASDLGLHCLLMTLLWVSW